MEGFYQDTITNTYPLIIYAIASILVVFISTLNFLIFLFLIFIGITALLLKDKKEILKISAISLGVIPLILILSMILSLDFSISKIISTLPKGISFSIMIGTGITFIFYLPTLQLVLISKVLVPYGNPVYALLAGFRTFPVFFEFSKKIFTAIKIRKAHTSILNFVAIHLQNVMMDFLDFLDSFINRFSYLDIRKLDIKPIFNYKSVVAVFYLTTSLSFFIYELIK